MKAISLLLSISVLLVACTKEKDADLAALTPSMQQKANVYIQNAKTYPCDGYSILEYQFNKQSVFVFTSSYCTKDGMAEIVNTAGEVICKIGGYPGNVTCEGIKFDSAAVYVRTVWQP